MYETFLQKCYFSPDKNGTPSFAWFPLKQSRTSFHHSPISTSHTLKKCIFFVKRFFLQIWYDVQVGLYFFFEKVDMIPTIPNICCYYVQTKKKEVMKSSNRDFSYLQFSKFYQKTQSKGNATALSFNNFSFKLSQHLFEI